jgi:hypothetical protein
MTPLGLAKKASALLRQLGLKTQVGSYHGGESFVRVFRAYGRRGYDEMGLLTINPTSLRITVEADSDPEMYEVYHAIFRP